MQQDKKQKTKRTRKSEVKEVEITTDTLIQIFINEIAKITEELVQTNERINEIADKLTPKKLK